MMMSSRGGTEACLAVEREQEKVIKKMRTFSDSSADKLQKIIDQVAELKLQLSFREYSIWCTPPQTLPIKLEGRLLNHQLNLWFLAKYSSYNKLWYITLLHTHTQCHQSPCWVQSKSTPQWNWPSALNRRVRTSQRITRTSMPPYQSSAGPLIK